MAAEEAEGAAAEALLLLGAAGKLGSLMEC
jgi:hypothetical protein